MDKKIITQLGDELYQALITQTMIEPLTNRHADITIENAYNIQQRNLLILWSCESIPAPTDRSHCMKMKMIITTMKKDLSRLFYFIGMMRQSNSP